MITARLGQSRTYLSLLAHSFDRSPEVDRDDPLMRIGRLDGVALLSASLTLQMGIGRSATDRSKLGMHEGPLVCQGRLLLSLE